MGSSCAGRVAVVTGGSRGIGRAIAIRLASEGADLALVARDVDGVRLGRSLAGTAEATLALATAPAVTLQGEVRRSLELLAELGRPVLDLRGESVLPGYAALELADRIAELEGEASKPRDLRGKWGQTWGQKSSSSS